jgi:hypothetical protein
MEAGADIDAGAPSRWQLPCLRLHLFMRDMLATPWGKDWPIVKRELVRCAELRRAMIQAGRFN